MEGDISMEPVDSQPGNQSIVSIIGIGSGAGSIVDKIQAYDFLDTELYALGRNCQEMAELPLPHQYLSKFLTCFIVCLEEDEGDGIRSFLQKAADTKIQVKLLVVTLPPSSAGIEKRDRALKLLDSLEELVDSICVIDCDTLSCGTLSEAFEEGSRQAVECVGCLVGSIVHAGMLNFGYHDVATFLRGNSNTKYIEHFALSGNITYLKQESKDLSKYLPSVYTSVDDISTMILLVSYNRNTDESAVSIFLEEVVLVVMQSLNENCKVKWGMYPDAKRKENTYRLDIVARR